MRCEIRKGRHFQLPVVVHSLELIIYQIVEFCDCFYLGQTCSKLETYHSDGVRCAAPISTGHSCRIESRSVVTHWLAAKSLGQGRPSPRGEPLNFVRILPLAALGSAGSCSIICHWDKTTPGLGVHLVKIMSPALLLFTAIYNILFILFLSPAVVWLFRRFPNHTVNSQVLNISPRWTLNSSFKVDRTLEGL